MTIDSLPALIDRLRDPGGYCCLDLRQRELESLVKYTGVDDFAETFVEFLDAIKANSTVTWLNIGGFSNDAEKGSIFPIINPLLRHLPTLKHVTFRVVSSSPIERFLFKDAAAFTSVTIVHEKTESDDEQFLELHPDFHIDDERVLELHPDLHTFRYINTNFGCTNAVVGPVLLALPLPSKLRELTFSDQPMYGEKREWDNEMARPFTEPELTRLVDIMQASSLVNLVLEDIRLASMEECDRFARGLAASPATNLFLRLYTPHGDNYREIVRAISGITHLELLEATFELDHWEEDSQPMESFSIPLGDIVRGVPEMKFLTIAQGWKPWDEEQCRDLAMAIQAPSCELQVLDMSNSRSKIEIRGAATIMSTFSAPSSSIENFSFQMAPGCKDEAQDFGAWLSMLPRTTALRSLTIEGDRDVLPVPALTESQQESFLDILSGWHYLTQMSTYGRSVAWYFDEDCREQLETLLRLNEAGRHYLTSPTRSKADGVKVLVNVRSKLNDIYTHLLENPCLCDRGVAPIARRTSARIRKKARHW